MSNTSDTKGIRIEFPQTSDDGEPTPNSTKAIAATQDSSAPTKSTDDGGLMSIFPFIYKLLAAIAVLLFVISILLSLTDLLTFSVVEIIQKIKTVQPNYSYLVDDSNEYKLLEYSSKYLSSEPYLVYTQNTVLNMAISVVGFAIILFAIQLGIFLILKIRAAIYNNEYKDTMQYDNIIASFSILAVVFLGGVILNAVYKSLFRDAYQKAAITISQELKALDTQIRNGLTKNAAFIGALQNHNMPMIYNIFKEYAANAKSTNNYSELQKLFFTMSVFNYFDSIAPAGSDARNSAMALFDVSANKDVQPHALFFYQGTNSISSVFDVVTHDATGTYRTEFANLESAKMLELSSLLDTSIKSVNDALLKLKQPSKLKIKFLFYILMYILLASLIIGALWYTNSYMNNRRKQT